MSEVKLRLMACAGSIRYNNDRVSDAVVTVLHDMMWDMGKLVQGRENAETLRMQVATIWQSSRCANGSLVRLALELLANTLKG